MQHQEAEKELTVAINMVPKAIGGRIFDKLNWTLTSVYAQGMPVHLKSNLEEYEQLKQTPCVNLCIGQISSQL